MRLHCDMNNYFASVEMINHPEYREIPMAVCGDPSTRHGIILAKNYIAKNMGVMTGESIYSAAMKIPSLKLVYADYRKYIYYAKLARNIYSEYSDDIVPYGLDEAWIDLPELSNNYDEAYKVAHTIKERVKSELKLTASVGVSFNYIFSKLASDMKKPDAITVLRKADLYTTIWNMPAFDLLFVGPATRKKLQNNHILTIGDIAQSDPVYLRSILGKVGINLWMFANGNDSSFNPKVSESEPFKSIGNTITLPKDSNKVSDIYTMLYSISDAVAARLKKHKIKTRCINLNLKYNDFHVINRQTSLSMYTDDTDMIFMNAKLLFDNNFNTQYLIRSIGIQVKEFDYGKFEQLSLFPVENEIPHDIQALISDIQKKIEHYKMDNMPTRDDSTSFWEEGK